MSSVRLFIPVFAEASFGVRGGFGASIVTITDSQKKELGEAASGALAEITGSKASYEVSNDTLLNGGFALFGNYGIDAVPGLGVQAELGFLFNNGSKVIAKSKSSGLTYNVDLDFSYTTMEIPVLLTYTVNKGKFFEITPQAGLYFSIPLGKCKEDLDLSLTGKYSDQTVNYSDSSSDSEKIDNSIITGVAFGSEGAFNFSETSALVLNARCMYDFNKLKVGGDELARRIVFLFSAGYKYTIR